MRSLVSIGSHKVEMISLDPCISSFHMCIYSELTITISDLKFASSPFRALRRINPTLWYEGPSCPCRAMFNIGDSSSPTSRELTSNLSWSLDLQDRRKTLSGVCPLIFTLSYSCWLPCPSAPLNLSAPSYHTYYGPGFKRSSPCCAGSSTRCFHRRVRVQAWCLVTVRTSELASKQRIAHAWLYHHSQFP
jgi:hypothetical protein